MLEGVKNSVFWLDVFGFNMETVSQLAGVRKGSKGRRKKKQNRTLKPCFVSLADIWPSSPDG